MTDARVPEHKARLEDGLHYVSEAKADPPNTCTICGAAMNTTCLACGHVQLPPLDDECSNSDVVLRGARWTERVFAIIDDEGELIAEGDAANLAGIEAEWALIQRERQLLAALRTIADLQTKLNAPPPIAIPHFEQKCAFPGCGQTRGGHLVSGLIDHEFQEAIPEGK